ncbi:hypothetical protein B0H10DRAFT_2064040 [Mycena sp. CBHHK59/15]|nr:hypothetical protein B0H10DRAFT_2064040 [Mycena sp. CBHHK59/15]
MDLLCALGGAQIGFARKLRRIHRSPPHHACIHIPTHECRRTRSSAAPWPVLPISPPPRARPVHAVFDLRSRCRVSRGRPNSLEAGARVGVDRECGAGGAWFAGRRVGRRNREQHGLTSARGGRRSPFARLFERHTQPALSEHSKYGGAWLGEVLAI